ncbi:hypothetical protein SM0020_30167 [Sinorhizobium meliloti CCNWSX0020]|uniref:Transmembrane protein n=1 Tax=Sinorhizobium meliloti CCNWSX0020 TaxID=1107881 RepID=H0G932_RHIML|nr:phage holin family protein [Sinorhizobium meliloti]PII39031.1 hypothetical protein T190_11770 [Sinorhizobium meliloti CCBAU 01290]EHK74190.1 hypothetical protein SM0020_30167 [Sinorhizobium meliloti CCNWSX0020]QGJ76749.1 hypothetical protein C3L21_22780 [Sinorhizobium meliloti]RVE82614.1 hypothetical protein CN235_32615 [Sinorhizobium meliloti]RVG61093.1 hypothetical protein CN220_31160 [Sinorhizobium meliloti]
MRRKFFGKELLWEIPIAVGMAFLGAALASWLALEQPMATGLIAALAYLGPRGSEVLFMRWLRRNSTGKTERPERAIACGLSHGAFLCAA